MKDGRGFSQKSHGSFFIVTSSLAVSVIHDENIWRKRWRFVPNCYQVFLFKKEQLDKNLVQRCSSTSQCWIIHWRIYQIIEWAKSMAELQRKVGTPSDLLFVTVFRFCMFSFMQCLSITLHYISNFVQLIVLSVDVYLKILGVSWGDISFSFHNCCKIFGT